MSNSLWPNGLQPGPSILHCLLEFAQIHVHWVEDVIWSPHPLLHLSPFAFSLSRDQGLFQCINSLHQMAKVLVLQLQPHLPVNIQGWFLLGLIDLISLQSKGLSSLLQHYNSKASNLQHSTFCMVLLSHLSMTTGKNHCFAYMDLYQQSDVSAF